MSDTYFEYTLSKCRTQGITSICGVVSTRNELIGMANSGFNGCFNVTADWRLLETVKACLYNQDIINPNTLSSDALEIYKRSRCRIAAFSEGSICYERLFDLLVEINWLQASIQNAKIINSQYVELLSSSFLLPKSLKKYLHDVYNGAIKDNRECIYIEEAIQVKGKLFKGLYPFQYEESKNFASTDFTISDLELRLRDRKENSIMGMSLFLGLTATAALAEDIRRGRC